MKGIGFPRKCVTIYLHFHCNDRAVKIQCYCHHQHLSFSTLQFQLLVHLDDTHFHVHCFSCWLFKEITRPLPVSFFLWPRKRNKILPRYTPAELENINKFCKQKNIFRLHAWPSYCKSIQILKQQWSEKSLFKMLARDVSVMGNNQNAIFLLWKRQTK